MLVTGNKNSINRLHFVINVIFISELENVSKKIISDSCSWQVLFVSQNKDFLKGLNCVILGTFFTLPLFQNLEMFHTDVGAVSEIFQFFNIHLIVSSFSLIQIHEYERGYFFLQDVLETFICSSAFHINYSVL